MQTSHSVFVCNTWLLLLGNLKSNNFSKVEFIPSNLSNDPYTVSFYESKATFLGYEADAILLNGISIFEANP